MSPIAVFPFLFKPTQLSQNCLSRSHPPHCQPQWSILSVDFFESCDLFLLPDTLSSLSFPDPTHPWISSELKDHPFSVYVSVFSPPPPPPSVATVLVSTLTPVGEIIHSHAFKYHPFNGHVQTCIFNLDAVDKECLRPYQ